jgi:hypothetical protein
LVPVASAEGEVEQRRDMDEAQTVETIDDDEQGRLTGVEGQAG